MEGTAGCPSKQKKKRRKVFLGFLTLPVSSHSSGHFFHQKNDLGHYLGHKNTRRKAEGGEKIITRRRNPHIPYSGRILSLLPLQHLKGHPSFFRAPFGQQSPNKDTLNDIQIDLSAVGGDTHFSPNVPKCSKFSRVVRRCGLIPRLYDSVFIKTNGIPKIKVHTTHRNLVSKKASTSNTYLFSSFQAVGTCKNKLRMPQFENNSIPCHR